MPPIDQLVSVEADSPEQAARLLVDAGRVPQDRPLAWVRVVLSVHPNGQPRQVLRLPLEPLAQIPIESAKRRHEQAY